MVPNTYSGPVDTSQTASDGLELATFAGGCFWGVEQTFANVPGVRATECGYSQGNKTDPTYAQVCAGRTGHAEVVRVQFDPQVLPYDALLEEFWGMVDATDAGGQGADRGPQYRTLIVAHTAAQAAAARRSAAELAERLGRKVRTEVVAAAPFWRAEEAHQCYFQKGGLDPNPETPYWMGNYVDLDS